MWRRFLSILGVGLLVFDWLGRVLLAEDLVKGRLAEFVKAVTDLIPPSVTPYLLIGALLLLLWDIRDRKRQAPQPMSSLPTNLATLPERAIAQPDPKPDWSTRELISYVEHLDPAKQTGDSDITLGRVQRAFKTGKLQCWGIEATADSPSPKTDTDPAYADPRLSAIDPAYWDRGEIDFGYLTASRPNVPGRPWYWVLHVNKEEALKIWPEFSPEFCSLSEVIEHVAPNTIHDRDANYPRGRASIRQAAADGKITIRGRREIAPNVFRDVIEDIPSDYWQDHIIAWGEEGSQHDRPKGLGQPNSRQPHTRSEFSPVPPRIDADRYADLFVSREQMLRVWPN